MFRDRVVKSLEVAFKQVFVTLMMSPLKALLLMLAWNMFLPELLPQLFNFRQISYYESWLMTLIFSAIMM